MRNRAIRLLVIEDEQYDVRRIRNTLKPFEQRIRIHDVVATGQAALDLLTASPVFYDVIVMDFQIAGGLNGENLIREIREIDKLVQIIVITKMTINITDFEFANRLIEAGAMWYGTKYPGDIEDYIYQPTDFILSILNAYDRRCLEQARIRSEQRLQTTIDEQVRAMPIIGNSQAIRTLREQIRKCARTDTNVLILGASGTGKELVARHIHLHSARRQERFIPVNCGSIPDHLIESELFGFEKGAFTGADNEKPGVFESADRGSIFLDEIGELPLQAQVKLLRVLQEGEVQKIGRNERIKVNTRVIAATNRDLISDVESQIFREDLFYRLNVLTVQVPDVRDRKEDIPELVYHFFNLYAGQNSLPVPSVSEEAMAKLVAFEWPGNVRQIQNVVQRLLLTGSKEVSRADVELALSGTTGSRRNKSPESLWSADKIETWRNMERELRKKYFTFVRENSGSDADAARKLGLAPPNYYRMCKEIGLK
jgi:two-component system response regulator AtoC